MQSEIEEIFNLCTQIRNSILKVQNESSIFQKFPFGCCRDSSVLIGLFLTKRGLENICYCHTTFQNCNTSHAWLEYKSYIIDITASQFGDIYPHVIVESNKVRREIHMRPFSEPCNLGIAGMDGCLILKDYELIKMNLDI
ncbi:hypothetical protein GCM10022386_01670 [Flavobacterium cheonhonense]|uniref:Microcin J25-processing protein McjB C-terminal domain-containing protein n=1 Tax=Flavobacterium cheonhonense TaxID=706185 RepID=A0ABP7T811_9FLAO|nr:hypothetical protein [Flavobacterium cheonhonense]